MEKEWGLYLTHVDQRMMGFVATQIRSPFNFISPLSLERPKGYNGGVTFKNRFD